MTDQASKEVIKDLRKSLAWLDLVLATLSEGVVVLDAELKVVFANDAIANMVGKQRIMLLGEYIWEIVRLHDDKQPVSKNTFLKLRGSNPKEALSGIYQLQTNPRNLSVELTSAHIPNTEHTVLIIRDVTDQIQTHMQQLKITEEAAARRAAEVSERRLLIQYEVASLLAKSFDQGTTITETLSIVCKGLGWRVGMVWVPDKHLSSLQASSWWPSNTNNFKGFFTASTKLRLLKGQGLPGTVWNTLTPSWSKDVASAMNFPRKEIAKEAGLHGAFAVPLLNGIEFMGVMEFFSEHVQERDDELLKSMATVGMQVAEYMRRTTIEKVTTSLREQRARLLEINEAKDEFISLASHQLRTPATGVKQYIGMLIEGYGGELSETQRRFAKTAYESNERQLTIVNDLLKVAQVDAGKVSIRKEPVDLELLLNEIMNEQSGKFKERRQNLSLVCNSKNLKANVDGRNFRMAVENIIDNASKYTEAGKEISITISRAGGLAVISIKDQGVGIAPEDTEKIFQKFTRVHNSLSISVGGSGLGLYWCKRIIELHEGSIKVESKLGEGSAFIIEIPIK